MPDTVRSEPFGVPEDARKILESLGHRFAERPGYMGDVEAIMIDWTTGLRWGASDMRYADSGVSGY
jgi:gamma-glutamyltranspeptidase